MTLNLHRAVMIVTFSLAASFFPSSAGQPGSIYHVEKMNTTQIRALDRNRTAVLLPGGILEEHGPYLPAYTDGILSERMTEVLSKAIVEQAGWNVLVFPTIPLGTAGSNEYGNKYTFPGTYVVRADTLRAVFMDLATELGEQGFRWIFVIHVHGAGPHNRAIDQAGDYFHDTCNGQMVHLWGQVPVIQGWGRALQPLSPAEQREEGAGLHAGMDETSLMLYLEPKLVSPDYKRALPVTGADVPKSVELAKAKDWEGYFGSPRLASAALGEKIWKSFSAACVDHALKILKGADNSRTPRYGDLQASNVALAAVDKASTVHEKEIEAKQRAWLRKKGLE